MRKLRPSKKIKLIFGPKFKGKVKEATLNFDNFDKVDKVEKVEPKLRK